MNVTTSMSGFDDFAHRIDNLGKQTSVSFDELFTSSFMAAHTDSSSFEDMLQKSNFHIESQEDFENIQEEAMDSFIAGHSEFSSWNEMLTKAFGIWAAKQLGL